MPLPILCLMLCFFCVSSAEFVVAGLLPEIATDLSVSIPSAGLVVSAFALAIVVGGPILTALTARVAQKPLLASLLSLFIIGNLIAAMAPNYAVLLIARVVSGVVLPTFFAVSIVVATSMAPAGRQASTVARLTFGFNLAMILGTPIGTTIGQQFGWRSTFWVLVVVSTIVMVLLLGLIRTPSRAATGSALAELRIFRDRDVQLAIAVTIVSNVGVLMVFTYISPLLTQVSGFRQGFVPVLLLVYGTGATLGNFTGGWLADRALMPSLIWLLGVLATSLMLLWSASGNRLVTAVLVFFLGALAFSLVPGTQTRVLATASAAPTLAIAVNASAFHFANAFGAWLGGRVIVAGLGLRSLFVVGAVATAIGVVVTSYAWRRDHRRSAALTRDRRLPENS